MHLPELNCAHPAGESPTYDMLLACSRCATCQPVCPSYAATIDERRSPRGRVQLVRALEEGRLTSSPALRDALESCLDCRACETVCPNGILPGQISVRARSALQHPGRLERLMRDVILNRGLRSAPLQEIGLGFTRLFYQRFGLQQLLRSSGLLRLTPQIERLDRYMPAIPARSVRRTLPEVVEAQGEKRGRIGFFLGCAMNTMFASASLASVRVLSKLGYDVVIPRGVVCCGAPQMSLGEREMAKSMAKQNLTCFDGLDTIVTDCAACGVELKHYHALLEDSEVESFSSRVKDFSEFVGPALQDSGLPLSINQESVTWHAPCHLAHAQGICKPPIDLLKNISLDYRTLPEQDRCCGSAGIFWMTQPEIADHALARKLQNIRTTGAKVVATGNPGCVLQLIANRNPTDNWQVKYISVLVDEAISA